MGDWLRSCGLAGDNPLVGLLSMLIEDTVHSTVWQAPLVNSALGITIRGAGLTRAKGGMRGFWQAFVAHYLALGGTLKVGCRVKQVAGGEGDYLLDAQRGVFRASQVVSTLPAPLTARLGPPAVMQRLQPYLERDRDSLGGAIVVFLGVPEAETADQHFTHHQLMHDYAQPLGCGNNMFVSVSDEGDAASAPPGCRAVMISTHCELEAWARLTEAEYHSRKTEMGRRLMALARRVYPRLGERAIVCETATPRTYERFTSRPQGAVGGVRQTLANANQRAVPHDIGVPGFWLAGDNTWPGLGTVACVLGSRIVSERVLARIRRRPRPRVSFLQEPKKRRHVASSA
jgi:phytoene dehydrogenase-like protein